MPQCDSLPQCHASGELKEVGCRSVDGGGDGLVVSVAIVTAHQVGSC